MRIAVCLSGQPRAINVASPSLSDRILAGQQADFFVHFWSDSTLDRCATYQEYVAEESMWKRLSRSSYLKRRYRQYVETQNAIIATYPTQAAEIEKLVTATYQPAAMVVEPQRTFSTERFDRYDQNRTVRRRGETRIPNTLSMFYGIWRANELKRSYEEANGFVYDCVIRCRSDLFFFDTVDPSALMAQHPGACILPSVDQSRGGVNDQFAIGSSATMDLYANTYNTIDDYYKAGGPFHPQSILAANLRANGGEVVLASMNYQIVRGHWPSSEAFAAAVAAGEATDKKIGFRDRAR